MSEGLKEVKSKKEFLDILNTSKCCVDFFAPWCGPCRMMMPTIEEIAGEVSDITFVKVNVDDLPEIAAEYGISGIPRLIFFKNGKPVGDLSGARPKVQILSAIKEHLG